MQGHSSKVRIYCSMHGTSCVNSSNFSAIKKTMQSEIISAIFHGDMSGLV